MSKKGNLFYLIKSLTKSEKRHFKIFCFSEKANKNYLKLFEAYDKMELLDEAFIKQKFKKEKFAKQLHVTKNYLSNLILSSLRNYHSKLSKDAELKDSLRNIEILFMKELYDQCHYEIQKAERIASEFERHTSIIEILGWKRRLELTRKGMQKESLKKLIGEELNTIQKLAKLNAYWSTMSEIFDFINDSDKVFFEKPEITNPEKHSSLQSKILYHHLLFTYHTINNDSGKGSKYLMELIELLEGNPNRIKDDPSAYSTALNNLVGFHLFQKNYNKALPIFQKVKEIPEKYGLNKESKFTIKLRLRSYNIELEIYRDTKNWGQGKELIKEISDFLDLNQKHIPDDYLLMLWYQFAYIYFMANEYSNSLKWVNEILNRKFETSRTDLQSYGRLLNLMIHFELGNSFVLKYSVDNTRRWLKKKKEIVAFEQVLLKFFSKISNAPKSSFKALFKQLYTDLFEGEKSLISDNELDYLDFKTWIKNKV